LIVVDAALFVVLLALAGRSILRLAFGGAAGVARDWPLAVAAGSMAFYVLAVLARDVWLALGGLALLAAGGIWLIAPQRHDPPHAPAPTALWWEIVLAALVSAASVLVPVTEWDARSIWFYHAKVVFHDGFHPAAWSYVAAETNWSHPFYPKLLAALAGAMATLFGAWNDYLPKLALAVIAVPALLLGGRVFEDWRLRALFWLLTFTVVRRFMWNGYMDGLLALWSAVALLHVVASCLGRIDRERATVICAVALSVGAALKVEGGVIAACFAAGLGAAHALRWRALLPHWPLYLRAALFVVVPYAVWRLASPALGIGPGWASISTDYVARAVERLGEMQAILHIAAEMFRRTFIATLVLLAALLFILRRGDPAWNHAALVGLLVLALYGAALFFVYLGTPIDLGVHLQTSVSRTTMTPRLWVLVLLLAAVSVWRQRSP